METTVVSREDYEMVFTQGPWIIFGLPIFLYKRRILEEIGGLVDKVAKLDFKIDSGSRGRFARMAVFINLEKLLISQILVNDMVQRVEYKVLSAVCFACDRYGHV
ncbi:hypothetical protein Gogos_002091 [Gossypium gossypioides]|uniref:DUF4283 domain-containing protein n=1 Tax=Gossypium gossypioides TaxID=34282 RepID=A0A7J9CR47_GOSGO|nr:hypothetical protein [Gossypium gossypioides]